MRKASYFSILILIFFVAANLYPFLSNDAANFYLSGLLITKGYLPYHSIVDNKNPGILFLMALPALLFEWQVIGALITTRAIEVLMLIVLFRLLCHLVERPIAHLILFACGVFYYGLFDNGFETIYTGIPQIALLACSYYLYLKGKSLILTGVALGLATLFRQTAVISLLFLILHLFLSHGLRSSERKMAISAMIKLTVGFAIPLVCMLVYAWTAGWLRQWIKMAYLWIFWYGQAYGPLYERIIKVFFGFFTYSNCQILALGFLFWVLAVVLRLKSKEGKHDRLLLFAGLSFIAHLVEASLSGRIFAHHYMPLTLSLAFLLASAFASMKKYWNSPSSRVRLQAACFSLLIVILSSASFSVYQTVRKFSSERVKDTRTLAEWVRSNSNPKDKIQVWGYFPDLYLSSKRLPATSFLHYYLLTNLEEAFLPIDKQMLRQFRDEIKVNKPRYIFLFSKLPIEPYLPSIIQNYIKKNVRLGDKAFSYLELNPYSVPAPGSAPVDHSGSPS